MRSGRAAATIALCLWTTAAATVLAQDGLPAGEGADIVRARCLSCHGADLITSQRLSDGGWGREIDKMVRWGARVEASSGRRCRPTWPGISPGADAGSGAHDDRGRQATFTRACLACHGRDLTEQQRLTPAGWTREVEKMMRWGARVSDAERPDSSTIWPRSTDAADSAHLRLSSRPRRMAPFRPRHE